MLERAIVIAIGVVWGMPAAALSDSAFEARLGDAMSHYRAAVAYLRTGNAALASIEMEDMAAKWAPLVADIHAGPPRAYAESGAFAHAVEETSARLAEAQRLADEGALAEARAHLLPIRERHYAMRADVGRRALADCVLEANRLFAPLYQARREPPNLADTATHAPLTQAANAYDAKLGQCDVEAPDTVRADGQWRRLIDNARASLIELPKAVERKSEGGLFRYLIELISIDRLLFQRFG